MTEESAWRSWWPRHEKRARGRGHPGRRTGTHGARAARGADAARRGRAGGGVRRAGPAGVRVARGGTGRERRQRRRCALRRCQAGPARCAGGGGRRGHSGARGGRGRAAGRRRPGNRSRRPGPAGHDRRGGPSARRAAGHRRPRRPAGTSGRARRAGRGGAHRHRHQGGRGGPAQRGGRGHRRGDRGRGAGRCHGHLRHLEGRAPDRSRRRPGGAGPARRHWPGALPARAGRGSDKYRRGVLGVVAGSDRFTGAAALAVGGALRGGAGLVRLVSAEAAVAVVRQHWPEAVITVTGETGEEIGAAGRVQAWLAGPGMGTDERAHRRLAAVLATDLPVLVDADGLTLVADSPALVEQRRAPTLLTPHAGELARLMRADPAEITARRAEHARSAARTFGCCVLLKGSTTVIAAADDSPLLVNPTGTGWLATGGTGDVLAGLAGALLAQGLAVREAAAAAAFLHGISARYAAGGGDPVPGGEAPIGAGDVIDALPDAIRGVREA